jgi:general secretion pathway protein E
VSALEARAERLGELMLANGQISQKDLDQALALQPGSGARIGQVLIRLGAVSEDLMYSALAAQSGMDLVPPDFKPGLAELREGLDRCGHSLAWWSRREGMPWVDMQGALHIATVDPLSEELHEAAAASGWGVTAWHLVLPALLERWQAQAHKLSTPEVDERSLRELAEDAPVITYVNSLMAQAVDARASDVHVEPGEVEFTVRMRIDGVLHERQTQPMGRFAAVASRIKLISGLDIAERRLPQDGRTTLRVAGSEVDVRVSAIPSVFGESIVMRLLPKQRRDLSLDLLGMERDHLGMFQGWLRWPNGMILVTGPTGSGKSTTLYGALASVSDQQRKIVTVEDPVELRLPNIVQIQTQADIGYTFARALRSILRHDPDIIMVGEIRDRETAEIAIQAALTGHLVLATLHTNDALSAITRLVDMGVEPFLVAAALRAVMAQRLVRRLCDACAIAERSGEWPRNVSPPASEPVQMRSAVGCQACQGTGFRGRLGIYELIQLGPELQQLIANAAPYADLVARANAEGRRSLVDDGAIKVAGGLTTWAEVLAVSDPGESSP